MSGLVVLDASVVAGWILPGQANAMTDRMLAERTAYQFLVPHIFHTEVASLLLKAERLRRISSDDLDEVFHSIWQMPCEIAVPPAHLRFAELVRVARLERLSVYDALYLELAIERNAGLASRDDKLCSVARKYDVMLET